MARYAEDEKNAWQKVKTVSDWEQFRDKRLAALLNTIGPFPERTPLNPAVSRRIDYGEGFVIENIVYESRPGLIVSANLYLPNTYSGLITCYCCCSQPPCTKDSIRTSEHGNDMGPLRHCCACSGLNKKATIDMMKKEYGTNIPNLTLTDDKEEQSFLPWLRRHIFLPEFAP
jgi:hypothetical protein